MRRSVIEVMDKMDVRASDPSFDQIGTLSEKSGLTTEYLDEQTRKQAFSAAIKSMPSTSSSARALPGMLGRKLLAARTANGPSVRVARRRLQTKPAKETRLA